MNDPEDATRRRRQQFSTRLAFLIAGVAIAAWAPLVPYTQARAHLTNRTLGLVLLCLGLGSLIAMPLAGALAARFGCRRILIAASLLICLTLPIMASASALTVLVPALFLFGAGLGSLDCVINMQAVVVERESGRPMMSGFHGLFSVGGIVGAGCVSLLLGVGVSPFVATLCVAAGILATLGAGSAHFLSTPTAHSPTVFALPRGPVLLIGALCLVVFMAEGSALDWSAVFLNSVRGVDPAQAGLGYAAFATTMTAGRLTGDKIVRRFGGSHVITLGGLCAAMGLAIVAFVPNWLADMAGYALVGAGCSNIVVLYTAVGRQKAMPEHIAVSTITTLGYAAILAGPAAIGFVASVTSLSAAFLIIATLLLFVSASGPVIEP